MCKVSLSSIFPAICRGAQRLLGVILAILAGGLCGVQGVPATLWAPRLDRLDGDADAFGHRGCLANPGDMQISILYL